MAAFSFQRLVKSKYRMNKRRENKPIVYEIGMRENIMPAHPAQGCFAIDL